MECQVATAPSSLARRARSLTPRGSAEALPLEPLAAGDSLQATSAAATVLGFDRFRPGLRLAGVIFNRVGGERHERM
ncbi:MAG: hypothetical protein WCL59_00305, partial [Cyanobium sp. ELA507]